MIKDFFLGLCGLLFLVLLSHFYYLTPSLHFPLITRLLEEEPYWIALIMGPLMMFIALIVGGMFIGCIGALCVHLGKGIREFFSWFKEKYGAY